MAQKQKSISQEAQENVLEVRDARVTFDMDRGESRVLDDVSMDIKRDEVLGVVGESGSGKSMLADSILNAVVEPGQLSGEITYYPEEGEPVDVIGAGEDELERIRWESISMVFQGAMSSFNPTMKIRDHFLETLDAHDYDLDEGMERAHRLLEDLYLDPERVLSSYEYELSGGMRQRALIALSLILEPEVLVMDEPTAALDLLMQRSILSLLRTLKAEYDLTLVFITHDLPLVTQLADRICVLYAFQVAEVGPTDEILHNSAHPYSRLLLKSTPNIDAPLEEMETISGKSPDPVNIPAGCSFSPRCPLATDECHEIDPALETAIEDDSHVTACHHKDEVAAKVPFSVEEIEVDTSVTADEGPPDVAADPEAAGSAIEDPILSIEDVTVEFETGDSGLNLFSEPEKVRAVDGISLDIGTNDVVALVGESGCGKTTLGKAAIGVHRPASGTIRYRGHDMWEARDGSGDISWSEIRRSLQIIHQDPASALNPNQRVITTLEKPLKRWEKGLDRVDREDRIYRLLSRVGMEPATDYANRYPHQLSGGEKQRVALIRALLMNPDLILADEAISALDVSLRVEMMELMLELQDVFETSFLFISHDMSNARYLAEQADGRIAVMYLGEIVEIGPVDQIINNPQHPYTKVLLWATPNLDRESATEPPVRKIDIPDPVNPPSGCRFHTRCPEAREVCTEQNPESIAVGSRTEVGCFRVDEDHEYWHSEELTE